MNKIATYIGCYTNHQESLFYGIDSDTYYDLKADKKVCSREIRELIPFNNVVECWIPTKRNMIRCYDKNRMQKVKLDRTFIGNVYIITDIISEQCYGKSLLNKQFRVDVIEEDVLLTVRNPIYLYSLDQAKFFDLETEEEYQNSLLHKVGNIYIPVEQGEKGSVTLASVTLGIKQTEIEKGKMLEKYREWRNR